ncbi:hypothetical protein SANA_01570 [Gottschalkiaceae bacterium SANA]|nr:hypothetical protein SANA_01570 [Gottschalkiaceae bacterium SANA]
MVSGISVYGSREQKKVEAIRAENQINEAPNLSDRSDKIGEEGKGDSDKIGQANGVDNREVANDHEGIVEKTASSGDEQAIKQKEEPIQPEVEPEKEEATIEEPIIEEGIIEETTIEEPIIEEVIVEEPVIEDVPVEPEPAEPEFIEPEVVPVPFAEPSPLMESFSDIFINEKSDIVKKPTTVKEFEAILLHMCVTDTLTYSIVYEGTNFDELLTAETQAKIAKAFDLVFNKYPEYMSFTNRMTYKAKGGSDQVTLTFILSSETGMDEATLIQYREAFFVESMEIVSGLKASGKIYDGQSDREKALILFDWVVQNTEYDNNFAAESYTGYGVYANGLGVCQGYTAAYNALSKCAGLRVEGVGGVADGVDHIWTRALFAGDNMYIDATWGDSYANSDQVNYDYFLVDGDVLATSHTW